MRFTALQIQGSGFTSQRTRDRMVDRLEQQAGITHPTVLHAMRHVPRHLFVEEPLAHRSYEDNALPIGYGQTISHPHSVARLLELLIADAVPKKILDVGTGSGYLAALLAALPGVETVTTIEVIPELHRRATEVFDRLGMVKIESVLGDGGLSSGKSYDSIVCSCTMPSVQPLVDQLNPAGVVVTPVQRGEQQQLVRVTRNPDGSLQEELLHLARFVPYLTGGGHV